ncbi:protein of unknown function [Xenorhabdus doucetiae]|uniref:Uncharacterized protein n=1 Tax=Xenorhabdus doucetiae TaxID=351671 RepID=A0A068R019_9GAMM|nr:protein of unknown function [Xenorhabdus doucetiae]
MQPGVALFKARHHAGEAALFHPVLQNGQGRRPVQHRRKVDGRVGTRQPDLQAERPGKAFRQGEVGDHKGLRRQAARRQGKLQPARGTEAQQLANLLQRLGRPTLAGGGPGGQPRPAGKPAARD